MKYFAVITCLALSVFGAQAATIIGTLSASDFSTTSGWAYVGQTFTVPVTDNVLTEWDFKIAGSEIGGTINLTLAQWNSGTIGATVYSTSVAWPVITGTVTVGGLSVALTSGQTYIMIYDLGSSASSIYYVLDAYSGGAGKWGHTESGLETSMYDELDTKFGATFNGSSSSVPEPSSMALAGLGVAGLCLLRRRRA